MPADEPTTPNQRQAERRPVITLLWYKVVAMDDSGVGGGSPEGIARTCDISDRGLGIVSPIRLPIGRLVFVEITSNVGAMSGVGTIVHLEEISAGRYRVGIRLQIVPPNDQAVFQRLLS